MCYIFGCPQVSYKRGCFYVKFDNDNNRFTGIYKTIHGSLNIELTQSVQVFPQTASIISYVISQPNQDTIIFKQLHS